MTFADICILIGTLGIHLHIARLVYGKIKDLKNNDVK